MTAGQLGALNPGDLGSDVFEIAVNGHSAPVTAIPSIRLEEYSIIAGEYSKQRYIGIDPANYIGVHYAWLTAEGPVSATITCPRPISKCHVHPARRKTPMKIDGNKVHLEIGDAEPRYYVVTIDDYPPLVLLIDPPETDVPDRNAANALDLGTVLADNASVAVQTQAFENAFTRASEEKKIAYVPAGVYYVNQIRLHHLDGLQIYFAPGSVLRTEVSPAGENIHSHGLWMQDSQNIRIWGRGVLDHQGFGNFAHGRNNYKHGLVSYYVSNDLCPWLSESPVFMMRCKNISMEGFMVRNGRNMNYNIRRCDNVTLRRCKILTPPASAPEYGDGYHFNSCIEVRVENCLAYCNDDCFASGHYTHWDNRDSGTHTVSGLVGWNPRANGVRLGFHTYYNQGDFLFDNCDFSGITWCGVLVHPLHDASEAFRMPRYGTVRFKNCSFDTGRLTNALVSVEGARMDAFELINVTFDGRKPMPIHGYSKELGIKNVRLEAVTLGGEKLKSGDADIQNADKTDLL